MDDRAPRTTSFSDGENSVTWSKESILFSACNEDTRSELKALGPLAGKHVFCVTAGGGRVLSLLLHRPKSVLAVDLNPAQSALLELKVAAMRALDHDGYLRFLGVRPSRERLSTYLRVRPALSPSAQAFFEQNLESIQSGVLFSGRLERFLAFIARVARIGHPFGLRRLFESKTLDEQRAMLARLETPLWRFVTQNLSRRTVIAALSGDPGFYKNLPKEMPLHEVIYDRIHGHMRDTLLRDNPLLQLVFYGRYIWEPALPIYLHADTYDRVKAALSEVKLDIVTGMVDETLADPSRKGIDAFSLSDISSYLSNEAHHRLFETVLSSARPGARLCSRANIYHRPLSPEHAKRVERDPVLERKLAKYDHACVHEFVVGAVK
jgi:S-adenosylmethionine-diacylglycerol 3-amino-3-carboxypropyl transferase